MGGHCCWDNAHRQDEPRAVRATGIVQAASAAAVHESKGQQTLDGHIIACHALGRPRAPPIPHDEDELQVGSVVQLPSGEGHLQELFVLCAHIRDQQWLCHPEPAAGTADFNKFATREFEFVLREAKEPDETSPADEVSDELHPDHRKEP